MTSIGYPDYFKPRDWTSGLIGDTIVGSADISTAGSHTLLSTGINQTFILIYALLDAAASGNGAGDWFWQGALALTHGFNGAGGVTTIATHSLIGNGTSAQSPAPLVIHGPLAMTGNGNQLIVASQTVGPLSTVVANAFVVGVRV